MTSLYALVAPSVVHLGDAPPDPGQLPPLTAWPTLALDVLSDPPTAIAAAIAVTVFLLVSASYTGARTWLASGYAAGLSIAATVLDCAVVEGQDSPLAALPGLGAFLVGLDGADVAVLALLALVGLVAAVVTDRRWVADPAARARHWHPDALTPTPAAPGLVAAQQRPVALPVPREAPEPIASATARRGRHAV